MSFFGRELPEGGVPVTGAFGNGSIRGIRITPSLGILNTHFTSGKYPWVGRLESSEETLKFSFILSGNASRVGIEGEQKGFVAGAKQGFVMARNAPLQNEVPAHQTVHNLCLYVHVSLLESLLSDLGELGVDKAITALVSNHQPYIERHSMTPELDLAVRQLVAAPLSGNLGKLYLEAKVMEILALRLAQLTPSEYASESSTLHPREKESLRNARYLLEARITDPPSIGELAKEVGLNPTKLKNSFKSVFNNTIYGFVRDRRMEIARNELGAGQKDVTEVAFQVGYNSVSHFCYAFKQRYLVSPGDYRNAMPGEE